ncbi:MAG: NAD(P)-dependent oxidoreductase [Acidobacteria bacterium]|nr:NAD(P)-dependent oxidoreductase [Acidobacteriota bacterium]
MSCDAPPAVVVLGGTGFIGSHLVEHLARAGRPVHVISRRGAWPWETAPPAARFTSLDLTAPATAARLEELLAQTRVVVNVSGALLRPGAPADLYRRLHVEAVAELMSALQRRAGRLRLVHVSTTGVLGPTGPEPLDESAPRRPRTIYERTKAEGEERALMGRRDGLEVVVARPGLVYGPRDLHLLGLFRSIAGGTFRLPGGGRARWQPVAVGDVAAGLARLVDADGTDGEIFHLAGETAVSVADLAATIATLLGTRVHGPSLPRPLAWLAGAALEAACLPLGIEPPLSRMRVRTLTEDRRYDVSHARRRLGWQPRTSLRQGLSLAVDWYRRKGLLQETA